ncbi:hypothetical protein [Halobacillus sp. Marseille-Q1614]|uniref:hypothetical protein n=1 Tax=Halobacillus sp. Marseille-Q1614 TaxID=2709134 RepID=UPI0035304B45
MKKKLIILTMSLAISTGVLTACNLDNNEIDEGPADVNYNPTRYDNNNYPNGLDERDRPYMDEQEPDPTEEPSEQRRENQRMDEQEPDLTEEPSEQRRDRYVR